jgi:endonuclease G
MFLKFILLILISFSINAAKIQRLDYAGFTLWVDGQRRGAVKFQYKAQQDSGSFQRHQRFYYDPVLPERYQQISTQSYKNKGQRYDRGHLVPANHLDYSKLAIKQSNYMTNILPQAANMNRGAWLRTEEIIECYRDIDELLVIGGVIWGNNTEDDFYIGSHGVATSDAFWKVIIRNDRVIAWIVPNSSTAPRQRLDDYLVSVDEIERVTGETIPIADYLKYERPKQSWLIPHGCNKG